MSLFIGILVKSCCEQNLLTTAEKLKQQRERQAEEVRLRQELEAEEREREAKGLRQQQERDVQEAKRKLAEQAAEMQLDRESLQATKELQAASITRQEREEENDRGGYIFHDQAMLDVDQPAASNRVNFVAAKVDIEPTATTSGNVPGTDYLFQENLVSNAEPRSHYTAAPTRVSQNPSLCCEDLQHWPHLSGVKFATLPDADVLLHRVDAPQAFWTLEERRSKKGEPYAVRTALVCSLTFPASSHGSEPSFSINHVMVTNAMFDKQKNVDESTFEVVGSVEEKVCVDDCMKSCDTASGTLPSVQRFRDLLCAGGYLLKWLSNGVRVRKAISECDRPHLDTSHALGVATNIVLREWWRFCRWQCCLTTITAFCSS